MRLLASRAFPGHRANSIPDDARRRVAPRSGRARSQGRPCEVAGAAKNRGIPPPRPPLGGHRPRGAIPRSLRDRSLPSRKPCFPPFLTGRGKADLDRRHSPNFQRHLAATMRRAYVDLQPFPPYNHFHLLYLMLQAQPLDAVDCPGTGSLMQGSAQDQDCEIPDPRDKTKN